MKRVSNSDDDFDNLDINTLTHSSTASRTSSRLLSTHGIKALDEDRLLQHVDSEFGDNGSRRGMSLQDAAEGESSTSSLSYSLHPPGEGGFHYKPSFDNVFKTTWEFFRTVVLQFLVEEASQYFLW